MKTFIVLITFLSSVYAQKLDVRRIQLTKNVSRLLDQLLKDYDKRLRPNYAGPPVEVGVTININNINSVSEVNMDYTIDMYIRQYWVDERLAFDKFDGVDELVIGSDMLHKIWTPDTFLENERKSYFHRAPSHNKFIRIKPDGKVLFSMRLTVTAACPMNFRYFPMDHQACHLEIESYGFRYDDIHYKWAEGVEKSLDVAPNILLPQFKHIGSTLKERKIKLSTGVYSRLTMTLYFMRNLGYYIIQIYIPSSMIVILSWVSFWIDRTAAPARVTLGITTVLTMVTFIWSTNASLPKISYVKGIDVYLVCCFFMTFACVIEYGMVSFIHRRYERHKRLINSGKKNLNGLNGLHSKSHSVYSKTNLDDRTFKECCCFYSSFGKNNDVEGSFKKTNHNEQNSSPLLWKKQINGEIDASRYVNSHHNNESSVSNNDLTDSLMAKYNYMHNLNNLQHSSSLNKCDNFCKDHSDEESVQKRNLKNGKIRTSDLNLNLKINESIETRSINHTGCTENSKSFWCVKACTIDNYSRFIFPAVFFGFHVIYWTYYLNISSNGTINNES